MHLGGGDSNTYSSKRTREELGEVVEQATQRHTSNSLSQNQRRKKEQEDTEHENEMPWSAAKTAAKAAIGDIFSAIYKKVEKIEENVRGDAAASASTSSIDPAEPQDHILMLIHEKLDWVMQKTNKVSEQEAQLPAEVDLFSMRNSSY